ncbi:LysR substrate-binding domain-containing protein [Streptomyces sp. NPDC047821]|uniref:LysR substrate-binding domain-containing protein n=1 Tax=Streptomyces sp. NPDC047821 TaxID=3365488 RepID=UPI003717505B
MVSGATSHAFDVASFLADFHSVHPALEIALTEDTAERMQAALLSGEIDIALLGPIGGRTPARPPVIDTPLASAVSSGAPLPHSHGPHQRPPGRSAGPPAARPSNAPAYRPDSGPGSPSRQHPPVTFFVAPQWGLRPSGPA